jgi:hypothetical protein
MDNDNVRNIIINSTKFRIMWFKLLFVQKDILHVNLWEVHI